MNNNCKSKITRELNKTTYLNKIQACIALSSLNKKKITDDDIKVVSRNFRLKTSALKNSWKTFQESGGKYVDYRVKSERGTLKMKSNYERCNKERDVTPEEAAKILLEYMTTKINSRQLSVKHNVALHQIYSWIRELNVSGTLLGEKVLDPKKYAKLEVKDVIWMTKKPETKRKSIANLKVSEKAAYKRVSEVLLQYLPSVGKSSN